MGFVIIIAVVCVAEMLIRRGVQKTIKQNETKELKNLPFFLHRHHNYGMAGNRLQERPMLVKILGVAALSVIVVIFLFILSLKGKEGIKIGLALVIGGGLANLLERFLHGYVTDYIQFKVPIPRLRTLVFNVADFCVFIGGIIMILSNCLSQDE